MAKKIKVLQYGLGPIGIESVKLILQKPGLELVGAVDIDLEKVSQDVGLICGVEKLGIKVVSNLDDVKVRGKIDVAVHSTVSWLPVALDQILDLACRGIHVVSSTEELLFPYWKYPDLAKKLDQAAIKNGVCLFGTGVNPGFVLDTVAILMSGACTKVTNVQLQRVVDAGTRRLPLQQKVGAGISVKEFQKRVRSGRMGHAGFIETVALISHAMGWKLDSIKETIRPVITEKSIKTKYLTVPVDSVAGIHQTCVARMNNKKVVNADLKMFVGAENPMDHIVIQGEPGIDCLIQGGVAGDIATIAMLVNSIPTVKESAPGLKTVLDLPMPRYRE